MTPITISSDIPTNINTLEKLAAWVGLALARCNGNNRVLEQANTAGERVALAVLIKADEGSNRLIVRLSIPIDDKYPESTQKFWSNALPMSDTALPAAYKTN